MFIGFEYTNSATKDPDGLLFMYSFLFLILVDSMRTPSSISRFDNSYDNFFENDNLVGKLIRKYLLIYLVARHSFYQILIRHTLLSLFESLPQFGK